MPFDTLHRLPQTPGPPMLMVRLGSPVLMENNTLPLPRILRIMDIPDMPRILRLERHIIFLRQNNVKIRPIQPPDLFRPVEKPLKCSISGACAFFSGLPCGQFTLFATV